VIQHREWNPKVFFRSISSDVLTMYERRCDLRLGAEAGGDHAYLAWKQLPEGRRRALEAELLPVNDLCSSHARPYLDRAAQTVWAGEPTLLLENREWTVYDLAMRLFIASPKALTDCHHGYAVDMMEHFREFQGKHPATIQATREAKDAMKRAMAEHFRDHAGGARCQVEDYEGPDKFALFIYHEAEVTTVDRFDEEGVVVPEWQRPVVRIAAVYYPETCTLLVKAPRKDEREKLRDLFAQIFVGEVDYFEDCAKTPKYAFANLSRLDFVFPTHPADGIDDVYVTQLAVEPASTYVRRCTLDFEPGLSIAGVHEALAQHGIDLAADVVRGLRLQFRFERGGRGRYRTVSLSNPNRTNLRDTDRDRVIRRYLREWGIDVSRAGFTVAVPPVAPAAVL